MAWNRTLTAARFHWMANCIQGDPQAGMEAWQKMNHITEQTNDKTVVVFPPDSSGRSRLAVMHSDCRVYELNEAARARAAAKRKLVLFPPIDPNNLTAA